MVGTATVGGMGARWGMSPSLSEYEPIDASLRHAICEFATGVGFMAETGNTAELAALMERMTEALVVQANRHAEATVKPKLPSWAISTIVGLVVAFIVSLTGSLVTYGALQARVSALENSHPESISSLATEMHQIGLKVEELQRRFNDYADRNGQFNRK